MTDPAINVSAVWTAIFDLGFQRVRVDRATKGPYAIEVGYGSSTIRIRMYEDTQFLGRWDLNAREDASPRLAQIIETIRTRMEVKDYDR